MSELEVEGLQKSYGNIVVARQLNLTVETGERHVVIGPNGAGKTSLVHQIGGQILPDSGTIRLGGRDITQLPPEARRRLGLARTFQRTNLIPDLTAAEIVMLAVQALRGRPPFFTPLLALRTVQGAARRLLDDVGLVAEADQPTRLLSYGAQRQLEIAVALAGNPSVLMLDEPTSGMSPAETNRMVGLIGTLPRRLAMLIVEHDMDVVFRIADRITVMYGGEVLATGAPAEIRTDTRVRDIYLGTR